MLIAQLHGNITEADVIEWELALQNALEQIDDQGEFKIFINLYGFTATDIHAHKRFREIIPVTLAKYGWKVGYVDLFEQATSMQFTRTRGITCLAAAHVHHDATKIDAYEDRFGRSHEHFFTNPEKAFDWIRDFDPGFRYN